MTDRFGAMSSLLDSAPKPVAKKKATVDASTPKKEKSKPVVKAKVKSEEGIVDIDPLKVTAWAYDDRSPSEIEKAAEMMVSSIQANGQGSPILVRTKRGGGYEEIYGRVRLEACRILGIKVKAIVKDLTDMEAAAFQIVENEDRNGLSAWDKAKSYNRLIEEGIFPSVTALSARCNRDRTTIQKLVSLVKNIDPRIPDSLELHALGQNTIECMNDLVKSSPEFLETLVTDYKDKIEAGEVSAKRLKTIYQSWVKGKGVDECTPSRKTISGARGDYFTISKNNNGALLINFLKKGRELMSEDEIANLIKSAMDNCK